MKDTQLVWYTEIFWNTLKHYIGITDTLHIWETQLSYEIHRYYMGNTVPVYGKHRNIRWDTVIFYGINSFIWDTEIYYVEQTDIAWATESSVH